MKNEARLQRLIRKIVKEEVAKIQQERFAPPSPEEFEEPRWGMFDEPEFESMHRKDPNQDSPNNHARALPGWSEPHPEEFGSPPFLPRRRKK